MKTKNIASYVLNCILIIAIILIGLWVDFDKYNNEHLQERITDLEESEISLNMQLASKILPELVLSENEEWTTKEERIEELELILIAKSAVLIESYEFAEALESHIIMLKQVMDMNSVIYPEFVYIRIDKVDR